MALLTLACATPDTLDTVLVDARTGRPIADAAVTLSGENCTSTQAKTDAEGRLRTSCPTFRLDDPEWVIEDPGAPELRAWRVPRTDGVYTLTGTALSWLRTNTGLDEATVLDSTETVRLPLEIPGVMPRVEGDTVLLLAGGEIIESLGWSPLVPGEKRLFGTKRAPERVDPWVYLGVRFVNDRAFEKVPATPDPARVQDVDLGERRLRLYAPGAFPSGRYALAAEKGTRAFLVEF